MEKVVIEALPDERLIEVSCGHRDKELVEPIPGSRWQQRERRWVTRLSWAAMIQLRAQFDGRLEVGPQLKELSWKVYQNRVLPSIEARKLEDAGGDPRLTPLQRAGAFHLSVSHGALDADPQGSGKTPTMIEALKQLDDPWPALIVCPNGAKVHWRNEFATWWPDGGPRVGIVRGGAAARRKVIEQLWEGELDAIAINWEALRYHTRLARYGNMSLSEKDREPKELNLRPFRTVIADEVHRAQNPKSKQTRALWAIGDEAHLRFGLSGTAGENPEALWACMRFVAPDEYPTKTKWIDRYGLMSWNMYGGLQVVGLKGETRKELFEFLDPRYFRRPKKLILPQLPEALPVQRRVIDLTSKQRKQYKEMQKRMLAELDEGILIETNPAVRMLRLRQFCFATGELELTERTDKETGEIKVDEKVHLKDPSCKIDEALEIIGDEDDDTKIAFFASTRKGMDLFHERLVKAEIEHAMIVGGDEEEREKARVRFQDRTSGCNVAVCTFGAGAEAINLSAMDLQVFLERDPSFIKTTQADERGNRPGRRGPLRTYDVIVEGTVDERVHEIISRKDRTFQEVARDEETLREWLS